MHRVTTHMYEIIIGAVILGLGLLYLTYQSKSTDRMIEVAKSEVIESGDLYQQYSAVDINLISYHELYAIIMGTREFPIIIDGHVVEVDGNDYNTYFTYIREGFYIKTYNYDAKHDIEQIVFTYSGL